MKKLIIDDAAHVGRRRYLLGPKRLNEPHDLLKINAG
jgi:hypothetical protein